MVLLQGWTLGSGKRIHTEVRKGTCVARTVSSTQDAQEQARRREGWHTGFREHRQNSAHVFARRCDKVGTGRRPGEGHLQALQHDRLEVEDLGVKVDGGEGARGDDHTLELGKHRLHRQARIQAAQLHADHCIGQGVQWLGVLLKALVRVVERIYP